MTVGELRDLLATVPDDVVVVVDGYEYGYDDVRSARRQRVQDRGKNDHWAGRYDDVYAAGEGAPEVDAFVITRDQHGQGPVP